ncbi:MULTISPECIES: hypothetical protein [Acidobacterium]|uniref:Conserved domain protein n=1 Tax=Acidobacterium capsulatum (strain ATCC 51196 / DSM 11244 / BCRC 80197 / JCM 7670 / NBRC 15755 / NCIMB 13165 / 161) TaxID=240015 RepID=C1F5F1_ACIC5|nr:MULTISPECIES: hypothetical protein [Acidobacterium]ACO33388.1 conserved domain protein [Acidobacterium capsulatum ATCC 51196]HCT60833.1 hypothetical protein [Acidobacterium sp.]
MIPSNLSENPRKVLPFLAQPEWSDADVREELERVLQSRFFIKSGKLCRFLRTAVDYLLAGKAEVFKEYIVGTEVYDRPSSYDPNLDSIVRTEARRLRAKLREYYASAPAIGTVKIHLAVGSYVPVIERRHIQAQLSDSTLYDLSRSPGNTHHLAIFPFRTKSLNELALRKTCDLEIELTEHLSRHTRIKLFATSPGGECDPFEQLRLWQSSGVEFVVDGKVIHFGNDIIAQIQLLTLSGMILWTKSFDCRAPGNIHHELRSSLLTAIFDTSLRDEMKQGTSFIP